MAAPTTGPSATAPIGDTDGAREYVATGGDFDEISSDAQAHADERIVVNMGPQHPSTHGVLRLVLEIDGETVTEARGGIGFLHTGIEKNMEYRTWTQGVTFCTRMDYVAPLFQETAYCLATEKLLGITEDIPERATLIRVLMMELNRIGSHLICIGTGGNELGATTVMTVGFNGREEILRIFEAVTGLRMNHAYIRPGGVAQDLPAGGTQMIREKIPEIRRRIAQLEQILLKNPIFTGRLKGIGYLPLAGAMALGAAGPILRSAGLPFDLRRAQPYCGYENYDFEVPTETSADAYGRIVIRFKEMRESLKIVQQVLDRLEAQDRKGKQPVMVADKRVAWPAQLSVGSDGQGNSLEHIRKIMGTSMEALIHHFKLVTEGFKVPAGQVFQQVEHPKGPLGVHLVSAGGTRPYRAHFRDPSFNNLQALGMMCEGGTIADVVVAVASIDPVMGGVDR